MSIHSVSLKGRRDSNEDFHSMIYNENLSSPDLEPINFYGVYDGHGGKYVSEFLSENLPNHFLKKGTKYPLTKTYINNVYQKIQNDLHDNHYTKALHCGSTCLVTIQYKSQSDNCYYINVLNTGDSRCVICRDNIGIPLTKDHKPHWPEERHRIEELGGKIYFDGDDYRIKDLSVSRAFGDIDANPYVTCMPDIYRYRLDKKDKFIILACDGLWDKLSNQEVVNFILTESFDNTTTKRINKEINIAKKLGEYAIKCGSTDNITIIIVFFDEIMK